MTLEPGTLARAGQSDGKNHHAFWRTRRSSRDCRWNRRSLWGRRFRLRLRGLAGLLSRFRGNIGGDTFNRGWREGLGNGLLATATTASAATPAPATPAGAGACAGAGPPSSFSRLARGRFRCRRWRLNIRFGIACLRFALGRIGGRCGRLLRVEIGRLQRWRWRLASLLRSFLFAPL